MGKENESRLEKPGPLCQDRNGTCARGAATWAGVAGLEQEGHRGGAVLTPGGGAKCAGAPIRLGERAAGRDGGKQEREGGREVVGGAEVTR